MNDKLDPYYSYKKEIWTWRIAAIFAICLAMLFALLYIGEVVSTPVVKVEINGSVDGVAAYHTFEQRDKE